MEIQSKNNSQQFIVLSVKPYVKRFIELNYGLPADFSKHPKIQEIILEKLKKPSTQYDKKYENRKLDIYSEKVEIVVSKYYADRFGVELSITDSIYIARHFEHQIKGILLDMLDVCSSWGRSLKESIERTREKLGFDESNWKYESILKLYSRHIIRKKKSAMYQISKADAPRKERLIDNNLSEYSVGVLHTYKRITDRYYEHITGKPVNKKKKQREDE